MSLTWIRTHEWDTQKWRDTAACRDLDPDLFFPVGSTGLAVDQIAVARSICSQCQVTEECIAFAIATNQESGVWGGLTEDQRRPLRRAYQNGDKSVISVS